MNDPKNLLVQRIEHFVNRSIEEKAFTACELLLAKNEEELYHKAFGRYDLDPSSQALALNSVFDLASITKPVATATAIMLLVERGELSLEDRVGHYVAEFDREDTKKITIKQLLTHTSGLPAWVQLYDQDFDRQKGFKKLVETPLETEPGSHVCYSCLGFLLLAEIVRRITRVSLAEFCKSNLFGPMGLEHMSFNPDPATKALVPTAYCPLRGKMLKGVVHDENAHLFGGEGGNAGLFGTAQDLLRFCWMLIDKGKVDGKRILAPLSVATLLRNHNDKQLPPRALGWDVHTGGPGYASCGDLMPSSALGHLGFTGTSLWFHPKHKIVAVVLTNRVCYPEPESKEKIMAFRPKIHNLMLSLLAF